MTRQSYQVFPWDATKSTHPIQMSAPALMLPPNLLFASLASSAVAWCLLVPIKKRYEQLIGDTSEVRLPALHGTGGAGQRFYVNFSFAGLRVAGHITTAVGIR